ncbi:MAG: ribonuclease Z [Clostridia bacterium]|nr:ribonuclease Z [Clostridia bacterium]
MNIFVCVDKSRGMMFNNRRQSRDQAVIEKIIELSLDSRLLMSEYSATMFPQNQNIIVDNGFSLQAKEGDFCFVEDTGLPAEQVEKVFIFNWNRDYPADKYFDFDLTCFKRVKKTEFVGSSHKKITLEVYSR